MRPYFVLSGVNPLDRVNWVKDDVIIKNANGSINFELKDGEFPDFWSPTARKIVASKYFKVSYGETSVRQLVSRISSTLANWAVKVGHIKDTEQEVYERELAYLLVNQYFAFNSPVWFNCGLYEAYGLEGGATGNWAWDFDKQEAVEQPNSFVRPQLSACFIVSEKDDLMEIAEGTKREMRLFKFGSGIGANFSTWRAKGEPLSTGGGSSGIMGFLSIRDKAAGATKSGGTTRRAAKLLCLNDLHPELMEFINWKRREERVGRVLEQTQDQWKLPVVDDKLQVSGMDGYVSRTIDGQNSNNSVRLSDKFMEAYLNDEDWELKYVLSGKTAKKLKAREIIRAIAEAAHECADPGVQFDDVINDWNPTIKYQRYNASNPCCFTGDMCVDINESPYRVTFTELLKRHLNGEKLHLTACDISSSAKEGEIVHSRRHKIKKVWIAGKTDKLVYVHTSNGMVLKCTPEHKFLTRNTFEYVEAQNLEVDTELVPYAWDNRRKISITKIETVTLESPVWVYDLEVENLHNFAVSDSTETTSIPGEARDPVFVSNSEFQHLDDTACNLASLNLRKFYDLENKEFLVFDLREAVKRIYIAMDTIVSFASYPTKEICENSQKFRPLGMGFSNLGSFLMALGVPYDSDEGRDIAKVLTGLIHFYAWLESDRAGKKLGEFEEYDDFEVSRIYYKHRDALTDINLPRDSVFLESLNGVLEDISAQFAENQMSWTLRNTQVTNIAPCGTISFAMDCSSTGIEPTYSLVAYKTLSGSGEVIPIADQTIYDVEFIKNNPHRDEILEYISEYGTVQTYEGPGLTEYQKQVLRGATEISYMDHLKMVASVQPLVSAAISKTINMPNDVTVEDIEDLYVQAWRMGVKCVALYRDGCKISQAIAITKDASKSQINSLSWGNRKAPPSTGRAVRHKFKIGSDHKGYLHIGLYEDGTPAEIFVKIAPYGGHVGGFLDAWATAVSKGIQLGWDIDDIVKTFQYWKFDPSGLTDNPEIGICHSVVDYISRYLKNFKTSVCMRTNNSVTDKKSTTFIIHEGKEWVCPECGTLNKSNCLPCSNQCGFDPGCS